MRDIPLLERIGIISFVQLPGEEIETTTELHTVKKPKAAKQFMFVAENVFSKSKNAFNSLVVKQKQKIFHFLSKDLDGNTANIVANHSKMSEIARHKKMKEKILGFMSNTKIDITDVTLINE